MPHNRASLYDAHTLAKLRRAHRRARKVASHDERHETETPPRRPDRALAYDVHLEAASS